MKKTFKSALALAFCIATIFATMLVASAINAPKAKVGKITYNSVTISWAKISDADYYEVERSTDGKKWTSLSKSVKTTSYKDSSKLTAGKSYKYRVRAVEDRTIFKDVYSSWSSTVTAKPVPEKVTSLKASSVTNNSAKLTWKKVAGASGYEIQYLNGKTWKSYKKVTTNSISLSKLTLGKTYQLRVRAYRTVSKKAVYGAVSAVVKVTPSLKAPSTFVLKGVSTSSLTLTWSKVTGAKGYQVYNAATKKWINVKTATSYTVKSLKAGTKYSFAVRAYSGSYKGTQSATRSYITTPAKATGVKVTAVTDKTVTFSWSKAAGAAGYQPAIYDYATKKWTNIAATTKTSVTVSNLSGAKKYAVRVRAYVKNSNVKDISATAYGAWSSNVNTYTAPAKVSAVYLSKVSATSLELTWNSSNGAASYEYYNPVSKKWISTGSATKVTVNGLTAGTKYTFKVRAKASNRTSAESASYSFTTTPVTPGGVKDGGATVSSLTFSWNKVTGATGYQPSIYDYATKKWTNIAVTTGTSVTVKNLTAGKRYAVRVRAYVKNSNVKGIDANAYSAWSSSVDLYTAPAAPSSVFITKVSTTSFELGWSAVTGATSYEYYNPVSKKWISTGTATKVTVSGLTAATKYTFKVRVKASNRTGAETAGYAFITAPLATSVVLNEYNGTTAALSWSAVNNAAGYQVYIKDSSNTNWRLYKTTQSNYLTMTGLNASLSYSVKVRAYVKNSNVKNISATTESPDSTVITLTNKNITATGTSDKNISFTWDSYSGAVSYTIEKYDNTQDDWIVYDFESKKWTDYDFLSDDSITTTTGLNFEDKGKSSSRADVYRIVANLSNNEIAVYKSVLGQTSDITVTVSDYDVTLSVSTYAGYNLFQIYATDPYKKTELIYEVNANSLTKTGDKYNIKLALAPASYHSLLVIAQNPDKDYIATKLTDWLTFRTKDLKLVTSTSDSSYNASVNSQLLYLARAINNTKTYDGKITVKNASEVSYSIDYLKIALTKYLRYEAKGADKVAELFKDLGTLFGEDIDFPTTETEKVDTTLTFVEGKSITEGNTSAKLNNFIEPTTNSSKTAYLYGGVSNQAGWKNGFESVTTTKNSDGSYSITAVLKQESSNTNYHSGFVSSFNISDFAADGFRMEYFKVGKSTISAVIDADGYLKSYSANSPYSASMSADIGATMTMNISGTTKFNYTITR